MNQEATTITECCKVDDIRKGCDWTPFEDNEAKYASVEVLLCRELREGPEGVADAALVSTSSPCVENVAQSGTIHI